MKVIITRSGGSGISVMHLIEGADPAEEVGKWAGIHGQPLDWTVVPDSFVLPDDREFRGAWEFDHRKKRISINLEKARDIRRDQLRAERVELFERLDIAYGRADEAGDAAAKKEVAAERQRLRDITNDPRLDAATQLEHLREVTISVTQDDQ